MYHLNFPTYKGIPEKLKYIWKYKSLTLSGKLAFLRESYLPTITNDQDVDISSYMKQRIGNEMTDYIVEDCGWCQGSGNVPCDCAGHNEECCA